MGRTWQHPRLAFLGVLGGTSCTGWVKKMQWGKKNAIGVKYTGKLNIPMCH